MRRHELLTGTTMALTLILALGGRGLAQDHGGTHDVRVTVPTVLRLRLDTEAGDRVSVALAIVASNGRVRIDPATTRLALRANAPWELHGRFVPASPGDDLALHASLDGVTWVPLAGGVCLTRGGPTAGWSGLTVAYAVASVPSEGHHHGTVEYTLAYP